MNIFIDNHCDLPIYEQVYKQIKDNIICGQLQPNTALPSIRSLAKDLRISVITTKRAYEELEREGLIYTVVGKGSFVAEIQTEFLREQNLKKIEEHIGEIIKLSYSCGMSKDDVLEMVKTLMEE